MDKIKTYESEIYLKVNDKTDAIPVIINHFLEQKTRLLSDVMDAEYSRKKEMLVFASANKMKLYFYFLENDKLESLDLNFIPTCFSISPDGEYAVIGHDAHISHVDLNNRSIIKVYNVSCNVWDLVFGNNNWAYAFPKEDQWEQIRCINLNLNYDNETLSSSYSSIYEKTYARLHPKGKYIYCGNNYLEKYSITNGLAEFLYGSSGVYSNGCIWFTEDGNRLFTKSGKVYFTSEQQEYDMLYNGTIELDNGSYGLIKGLIILLQKIHYTSLQG